MKGIYGLCVAVALGIAGALFNFAYLAKKAQQVENVVFLGIKQDVVVNRGEPLQADQLCEVPIPKASVGNLESFAIRAETVSSVIGSPVWRTLSGPRLLLSEDLKTPPAEQLVLNKDERAMFINVDMRAFVPSFICPGDKISFLVPTVAGAPTPALRPVEGAPAPEAPEEPVAAKPAADGMNTIGPFKVLAVGNRLGSVAVARAAKIPVSQENVIVIRVNNTDKAETARAAKLRRIMESVEFRPLGLILEEQAPRQQVMP